MNYAEEDDIECDICPYTAEYFSILNFNVLAKNNKIKDWIALCDPCKQVGFNNFNYFTKKQLINHLNALILK